MTVQHSKALAQHALTPTACPRLQVRKARRSTRVFAKSEKGGNGETPSPGLALKAVWIGAENFGKLVGLRKGGEQEKKTAPVRKMSRAEVVQSIRDDYAQNYFVSGVGDMAAYSPDCLFADPFAGFKGVDRFKRNVSNLGGLMEDIQLEILDFKEEEDAVVTRWRFSALLQLPWRPRLAAAGGTRHVIDAETGRVVEHIESWDVEPGKVVKQLLRPASGKAQTRAEAFMLGLSQGDAGAMWLAASKPALLAALPVIVISLTTKAATGHGLPGWFLGGLEGLSFLVATAAALTEAYQVVQRKST